MYIEYYLNYCKYKLVDIYEFEDTSKLICAFDYDNLKYVSVKIPKLKIYKKMYDREYLVTYTVWRKPNGKLVHKYGGKRFEKNYVNGHGWRVVYSSTVKQVEKNAYEGFEKIGLVFDLKKGN